MQTSKICRLAGSFRNAVRSVNLELSRRCMAEAIEYSVVTIVKLVADRVGMIRTWQVFDTLRGGGRSKRAWAVRTGSDNGSEESLGILGNGRVAAFVQ